MKRVWKSPRLLDALVIGLAVPTIDNKVAQERCDALSGDARSVCISEAKARF